jgi:hypothetical protein
MGRDRKRRVRINERRGNVMSRGIEKERGRKAYCGSCSYTKSDIPSQSFF